MNKIEFIAEVGLNHNGNFALNYELIRQAKYSGANVVKFQLGWKSGHDELNFIDFDRLKMLKKWADYFEIELMFSIFTNEAYEMIKQFDIDRYKIASRTLKNDIQLVQTILSEGKPTYLSVGMWDDKTLLELPHNGKYLWCKSIYPTTPWDLLDFPKSFFGSPYFGYSDHSIGIDSALIAVSRGAKIVEKHFTLDKSDTTIRDHALSATPEEFDLMVKIGKEMNRKIELGV
jgi:sialic acid synthase SpsE